MTRDDLARILDRNPYPDEPRPQFVHVVFLNAEPPADLVDKIKAVESAVAAKGGRDAVTAIGPALYLHTPDGFGTSELAQMVFRIIGRPDQSTSGGTEGVVPTGNAAAGGTGGVVPAGKHGIAATARNWATATKLLSLCEDK